MCCVVVRSLLWSCSPNPLRAGERVVTGSWERRWSWEVLFYSPVVKSVGSGWRVGGWRGGLSPLWVGPSDHPHMSHSSISIRRHIRAALAPNHSVCSQYHLSVLPGWARFLGFAPLRRPLSFSAKSLSSSVSLNPSLSVCLNR